MYRSRLEERRFYIDVWIMQAAARGAGVRPDSRRGHRSAAGDAQQPGASEQGCDQVRSAARPVNSGAVPGSHPRRLHSRNPCDLAPVAPSLSRRRCPQAARHLPEPRVGAATLEGATARVGRHKRTARGAWSVRDQVPSTEGRTARKTHRPPLPCQAAGRLPAPYMRGTQFFFTTILLVAARRPTAAGWSLASRSWLDSPRGRLASFFGGVLRLEA